LYLVDIFLDRFGRNIEVVLLCFRVERGFVFAFGLFVVEGGVMFRERLVVVAVVSIIEIFAVQPVDFFVSRHCGSPVETA
jgi:hypothetical protein